MRLNPTNLTLTLRDRMVSRAGRGCGRAAGDRQFFYLNGRPVDVPRATRLLNESYRSAASVRKWGHKPGRLLFRTSVHVPCCGACAHRYWCDFLALLVVGVRCLPISTSVLVWTFCSQPVARLLPQLKCNALRCVADPDTRLVLHCRSLSSPAANASKPMAILNIIVPTDT